MTMPESDQTARERTDPFDPKLIDEKSNALYDQARIVIGKFGQPHEDPEILTIHGGGILKPEPGWVSTRELKPATYLETPEIPVKLEGHKTYTPISVQEVIKLGPDYSVLRTGIDILWRNTEDKSKHVLCQILSPHQIFDRPEPVASVVGYRHRVTNVNTIREISGILASVSKTLGNQARK